MIDLEIQNKYKFGFLVLDNFAHYSLYYFFNVSKYIVFIIYNAK